MATVRSLARLEMLGQLVSPVSMAHERVLPVAAELAELLPEGGLVRGRVMACRGVAATSLALAAIAPATSVGSWVAIVDVPTLGLDAARESGVALERIVAVSSRSEPDRWADLVVAASDGFDLVLTRVPNGVRASAARTVSSRVRRNGAVVVVLGDPGVVGCDGVLETVHVSWDGLGRGYGHLRRRTVDVRVSGRRIPGHQHRRVQLAG